MNIMFLIFLLGPFLLVVVAMIKEEQHYMKEVQLNQTLEIPCLEDMTSGNLSNYPLKWLVVENGRKVELVTKEPSCPAVYRNSSTLYGQRVLLGWNNALKIFPTKLMDDGKVFSCHVLYHPERVQKSSTTVRVFAYPKISVSLQKDSAGTSQINVSCVVRKAFPKPSLVWYMDRVSLMEQPGEVSVEQEDLQDSEGFYQLRSTLMLQGTHQTQKTFSYIKSNKVSSEGFTTMTSEEFQSTSLASLDFTSQASLPPASMTQAGVLISATETASDISPTAFNDSLTAASLNDSTTESPHSLRNATHYSRKTTLAHGNQFCNSTHQLISVTTSSQLNSTAPGGHLFQLPATPQVAVQKGAVRGSQHHGGTRNTKGSHFPWPTVVAVLLFFCTVLIVLGIRKWCQYQKEIMNRPPSFKPPPPPIKYTSMVESDGAPPSCHELENL